MLRFKFVLDQRFWNQLIFKWKLEFTVCNWFANFTNLNFNTNWFSIIATNSHLLWFFVYFALWLVSKPVRSKTQTKRDLHMFIFARFLRRWRVISSCFDWFIVLFVYVMIAGGNDSGFGFATPDWKPLHHKCRIPNHFWPLLSLCSGIVWRTKQATIHAIYLQIRGRVICSLALMPL